MPGRPKAQAMPRGARPCHADAALRLLAREGLVEGDVLVVSEGACRDRVSRPPAVVPGAVVLTLGWDDLTRVRRAFRTVVDVAGMGDGSQRRERARRLADLVEPGCFLHVVWPSQRPDAGLRGGPAVPSDDVAASFRIGWTLLGVRSVWGGEGADSHAWMATFVRAPARRRSERSVVRNFTDLGAFGSLDLGAATDRPPWGT